MDGWWLTYNDHADGGVSLTIITRSQLQKGAGVFCVPATSTSSAFLDALHPRITATNDASANPNFLTPNTTAGTLAPRIWPYGPHYFCLDLSISKAMPIRERVSLVFQAESLNVLNHPNLGNPNGGVSTVGFGVAGLASTERHSELRANLQF
jgi:hypothetical protein